MNTPARRITQFAVTVRDYDEAIQFYTRAMGFQLIEDTDMGNGKRWVRVRPSSADGPAILLARATTPEQLASVGNQTGGRVFIFLETDDFQRDYQHMRSNAVKFIREPSNEPYGTVAVFEDLYGNRFDLIQPNTPT